MEGIWIITRPFYKIILELHNPLLYGSHKWYLRLSQLIPNYYKDSKFIEKIETTLRVILELF
jgi:hypothetical protein